MIYKYIQEASEYFLYKNNDYSKSENGLKTRKCDHLQGSYFIK